MRLLTTVLLLGLLSCSQTREENLYVGDLRFYDLFRFGTFYNTPDSVIERLSFMMDTVDLNDNVPDENWIKMYLSIREQNLLYKPSIDLQQTDEDLSVTMLLDSADYDQFKKYKWKDLKENNKKVMVYAKTKQVVRLDQVTILYCTDLIEVKIIDGQTFPLGRSKFKILDYE